MRIILLLLLYTDYIIKLTFKPCLNDCGTCLLLTFTVRCLYLTPIPAHTIDGLLKYIFGLPCTMEHIPGSRRTVLGGATESATCQRVVWDEEGGHGVAFSVRKDC